MHKNGIGIEQDYTKAFECYTKAAEAGYVLAMLNLGWMYKNGEGVPQNITKVIEWYTKAAEMGNEDAKKELERLQNEQAAASGESSANSADDTSTLTQETAQPEATPVPEYSTLETTAPEPESPKSHLAGKIIGAVLAAGIVALVALQLTGVMDILGWLKCLFG